ncbi:MAG: hypothetical protein WCS27_15340 [Victivallaceae bacterium]
MNAFIKWTDAVRCLNEKIKSGRLIAGRNIHLEDTGCGIRISSSANPSENNKTCHMFKAIRTDTNKIRIVDGFADDPETYSYAGDALINDTEYTNIAAAEFTITANSYIYLIADGSTPTLQMFTSRQSYELGKSKTLISRVSFSSGKITKFSQEVHGPITGYIDGECE